MPIHVPGKRDRKTNKVAQVQRKVMVELSLTSMVDIFTILVIFLLQHYSSTGEILYIPKDVKLPQAEQVKELKPAHVISITEFDVVLDKQTVAKLVDVKAQKDWDIPNLRSQLQAAIAEGEKKFKEENKNATPPPQGANTSSVESYRKVTVQADRDLDFLTLKKIMFSITEAGASEINFAVVKKETPAAEPQSL